MDRNLAGVSGTGFTLVELLIVISIAAILLALVQPAYRDIVISGRQRLEVNRLLQALALARSEAILRNVPVSLCPSAMARTGAPECGGNYSDGWIVFSNADRDRVVDTPGDTVLRVFEAMPPGWKLLNRSGTRAVTETVSYLPDGSSRRNRTLLFCPAAAPAGGSPAIVMNLFGRPRLAWDWGECP